VSPDEPDPPDGPSERDEILADLAAHGRFLGTLSSLGVAWPPTGAEAATGRVASAPSDRPEDPEKGLQAVKDDIGDCRRCKLWSGRKTIVYGQGNPKAELMFVGEAPGADEDEQGLAFVGRAGQLLTDIIEKGLKMRRSDVWIGNILKCRPPQNRNPEPDEVLSCQPFLEAQIRAIRPRVLVGLGKFGAQWLLKTAQPITRLRGQVGEYEGIPVMPTYHPAYLLRNPAGKKEVWEDMKSVLRLLGRPVPGE
jgi:uracil-DNA glycosylase